MPSHQIHTFMDRVFFGKSYWRLHDLIDLPYLVYGRWHRQFFHDGFSTILIAKNEYPYDPIAVEAACLHVLLDETCSQNPELKKWLKKEAKEYYKKMKHSKSKNKYNKKTKLSPELKALSHDLKEILEARKWHNRFYGVR